MSRIEPTVAVVQHRNNAVTIEGGNAPCQSSGGDNDYWVAEITHPKRLKPYKAECEDLVELFEFTFAEGEAFKALWRKGKANLGHGKPGDSPLRNAQKVQHYGTRMVAREERLLDSHS